MHKRILEPFAMTQGFAMHDICLVLDLKRYNISFKIFSVIKVFYNN